MMTAYRSGLFNHITIEIVANDNGYFVLANRWSFKPFLWQYAFSIREATEIAEVLKSVFERKL